jgi:hypothetical protein
VPGVLELAPRPVNRKIACVPCRGGARTEPWTRGACGR